jgi:hypothetical protein
MNVLGGIEALRKTCRCERDDVKVRKRTMIGINCSNGLKKFTPKKKIGMHVTAHHFAVTRAWLQLKLVPTSN